MAVIAGDALIATSGLPEWAGVHVRRFNRADSEGQQQTQAEDSDLQIGILAAAFVGKGSQAGGVMDEFDGGFDFIAVLPPWTAGTRPPLEALFEQVREGDSGRVTHGG